MSIRSLKKRNGILLCLGVTLWCILYSDLFHLHTWSSSLRNSPIPLSFVGIANISQPENDIIEIETKKWTKNLVFFEETENNTIVSEEVEDEEEESEEFYMTSDDLAVDEDLDNIIAEYEDLDIENSKNVTIKLINSTGGGSALKPPQNVSHKLNDIWFQKIRDRFRIRAERVRTTCAKYKYPGVSQSYTKKHLLYYSKRYNFLACLCAKVGSSTWKSHLLHMKGINPVTKNIHTNRWENGIKAKNILGRIGLDRHLKTSSKVVTTRHPLERLVSAFKDKFINGEAVNRPQSSGHYRYFWRPAMRFLRKGRTANGKLQINFHEFLRYVVKDQKSSTLGDRHWNRIFRACSICHFRYDYIMKLESYSQDLAYLIHTFNITEFSVHDRRHSSGTSADSTLNIFNTEKERHISSSTLQYYLNVPPLILTRLFRIYQIDFEMFDYVIPVELKERVRNSTV